MAYNGGGGRYMTPRSRSNATAQRNPSEIPIVGSIEPIVHVTRIAIANVKIHVQKIITGISIAISLRSIVEIYNLLSYIFFIVIGIIL